ncbi:uncharacterized protein AMSG_08296, partial [Thecamonas trahens ATCC 50062]
APFLDAATAARLQAASLVAAAGLVAARPRFVGGATKRADATGAVAGAAAFAPACAAVDGREPPAGAAPAQATTATKPDGAAAPPSVDAAIPDDVPVPQQRVETASAQAAVPETAASPAMLTDEARVESAARPRDEAATDAKTPPAPTKSQPSAWTAAASPAIAPPHAAENVWAAAVADTLAPVVPPPTPTPAPLWRGMINGSNACYVHAVLQALLGPPRVYSALARLSTTTPALSPAETPTLDAFASLVRDIETAQRVAAGVGAAGVGAAFEPVYIYGLIDAFVAAALGDADGTQTTRQHDAHEWWTFLLSSLDDELRRLDAAPVAAELFAGTLVSQLAGPTGPPSVTRQPFLVLMLDLDAARTLTDALVAAMETEYVEYVDAASGTTHTLRRTPSFGALPPVLVLQCKRFVFHRARQAPTKVSKRLPLAEELEIPRNLCAADAAATPRSYVLRSIIEHRGESTGNGHYVAHVRLAPDSWLLLDDELVTAHAQPQADLGGVYLLVYEREHDA